MAASTPRPPGSTPERSSSPRSVRFRTEIGPVPARNRSGSGSKSVRFRLEIGPLPHRNRSAEPISMRTTTDLDAGCDRSRRGMRPISTKGQGSPSSARRPLITAAVVTRNAAHGATFPGRVQALSHLRLDSTVLATIKFRGDETDEVSRPRTSTARIRLHVAPGQG